MNTADKISSISLAYDPMNESVNNNVFLILWFRAAKKIYKMKGLHANANNPSLI